MKCSKSAQGKKKKKAEQPSSEFHRQEHQLTENYRKCIYFEIFLDVFFDVNRDKIAYNFGNFIRFDCDGSSNLNDYDDDNKGGSNGNGNGFIFKKNSLIWVF